MNKNLSHGVDTRRIANAAIAGATDIDGTVIDMQGYRGVRCIAALGALTATAVTSLKAYQSDAVDGTGDAFSLIATTAAAADTDSNQLLILEVCEPNKRYVKFVLDRGTANAVLDGMIVELFRAAREPIAELDATVSSQVVVSSPDES